MGDGRGKGRERRGGERRGVEGFDSGHEKVMENSVASGTKSTLLGPWASSKPEVLSRGGILWR